MFDDLNDQDPTQPAPAIPPAPVPANKNLPPGNDWEKGQNDLEAKKEMSVEQKRLAESKKELADIFSREDEPPAKPEAFRPKDQTTPPAASSGSGNKISKIIVPAIVIIVAAGIIGGGIWAYYKFVGSLDLPFLSKERAVKPENGSEAADQPAQEEENEAEYNNITEENGEQDTDADQEDEQEITIDDVKIPEPLVSPTDTDRDGLTDQEEIQLGTDVNSADSDKDALFDWDEVKIYQTNPLDPDTDGDGYFDGDEVRAGYDPGGSGKLY